MALSERTLIEDILAPLARRDDGSLGLTDDAAFLRPADGMDIVVTQDTLVETVHFRSGDPPDAIARKALRVNLSDLAAKGAEPFCYFLSLGLPQHVDRGWAERFAQGLAADQERFAVALYGGDTVRSPAGVLITVTACGTLPRETMVHRSGGGEGDLLFVTGTIGDGALGLGAAANAPPFDRLDAELRAELADRFVIPQPRVAMAANVRAHASAAMDISDGLAGDVALLARACGLSAEVDLASVPLSRGARAAIEIEPALFERAMTGGDDYELLCAVPPEACAAFEQAARRADVAVAAIGRLVPGDGAPVFRDNARQAVTFAQSSYAHF